MRILYVIPVKIYPLIMTTENYICIIVPSLLLIGSLCAMASFVWTEIITVPMKERAEDAEAFAKLHFNEQVKTK